jgi:deoxyribodipyrimidine photo-lyase
MNARVRLLNNKPLRSNAKYVLYWAQMNRRVESNHALAHAVELANQQNLSVLFYEGLTCDYPYANDRFHTFILEGVPYTEKRCRKLGLGYFFYLRKNVASPNDMLYRLAADAAAVVTDDYPTFVAVKHNHSVPGRIDIPYYAIDSSCIVPMNLFEKREYAAYTIRPKINRILNEHLKPVDPWKVNVPFRISLPAGHGAGTAAECAIDHSVPASAAFPGGRIAAEKQLEIFLLENLRRYARENNQPAARATSGLSPYLHFGHISSLEVALAVKEYAAEHKLMADEFLEQLIVRRELAFNFARFAENPESIENLPQWALNTLRKHASDIRSPLYTREQFEQAATHDELWNATQKELLITGKTHGYYRMYWGKKIVEWSRTVEEALATMIYLHDRYALDGRDPNTYTNILWCFGLHDRPWKERAIFGMVRYMSLDGMKRKTNVPEYIRQIEELG